MKWLLVSILFLTGITQCASTEGETRALKASQVDLKKIDDQITKVQTELKKQPKNPDLQAKLKKLKDVKYDREREIHHWEMLSKLHSGK